MRVKGPVAWLLVLAATLIAMLAGTTVSADTAAPAANTVAETGSLPSSGLANTEGTNKDDPIGIPDLQTRKAKKKKKKTKKNDPLWKDGNPFWKKKSSVAVVAADKVVVSTDKIKRKIPSTLFGFNVVYSFEKDSFWKQKKSGKAPINLGFTRDSFWRYPGGEVTSAWHWKNATGIAGFDSWNTTSDGKFASKEDWMGLYEYMKRKEQYGGLAMLGVNVRSGWKFKRTKKGLKDASDLAKEVKQQAAKSYNGSTWDTSYWFIDNEQYLKDKWKPELYAKYINLYGSRIRKKLPKAKFIANWHSNAESWTELLERAGKNINVMDTHMYWNKDGWGSTTWDSYLSITDDVIKAKEDSTYRQHVASLKSAATTHAKVDDMEVGYLEWGVGPSPEDKNLEPFQAAFMVADIFMQMIDSDLDMACYWPFRTNPDKNSSHYNRAMLDSNNKPTAVLLFLQFFKPIKECNLVKSTNQQKKTKTLTAQCKDGSVVVYIIRKADTSSSIEITGVPLDKDKPIEVVSWYAKNGETAVSKPKWVRPKVKTNDDKASLKVMGWSLTRVYLNRSKPKKKSKKPQKKY